MTVVERLTAAQSLLRREPTKPRGLDAHITALLVKQTRMEVEELQGATTCVSTDDEFVRLSLYSEDSTVGCASPPTRTASVEGGPRLS